MTSADIRRQYIDFFVQKHGHTFVPSSPVVPLDDPTLLFTNAGMNQFKPIFLGLETRSYTRAANTQKCIRAGGKHNDLDDVGRSRRHHTFFEMLGNWSFGDYFKKGAIEMAWELLTVVWKLDPARLHVTVHDGDEKIGVARDTEAANIWHKIIGLPLDHIHYGNTKDNFWEMGETGPCGPCTEIFYDRTPDKSGGKTVLSGEDPRVMEIWNNVFIQYNRNPDRTLTKLPAQHVDTGMGFERICQVLQGKQDNYATDLWTPIFQKIESLAGQTYGGLFGSSDLGNRDESPDLKRDIAFRVIADHARMATFAITDGAKPDNKGRDSVVRSVIRRAVRFGYQQFGLKQPFLFKLVDVVAAGMGDAFPELRRDAKRVSKVIETEETSFLATIERGLGLFEEAAQRAAKSNSISGKDAFDLHTTFGFPIDLTLQMGVERGLSVDLPAYEKLFEAFKEESGKDRKKHAQVAIDLTPFPKTDDSLKYDGLSTRANVLGWIKDGASHTNGKLSAGDEAAILLDVTTFYGEQGGQAGDVGTITTPTGRFVVTSTERRGEHVLHWGKVADGHVEPRQWAMTGVDNQRIDIQRNHTATHLMNLALRTVLGDHVEQRGSLVDADKLRFDFTHDKAVSLVEQLQVERLVNERIYGDLPVSATTMPLSQAKQLPGVRAVFGEKYPDPVRVVAIGTEDPRREASAEMSIEFCGGTHLRHTGQAGFFKIVAEESVSKGVRRLTAVTGRGAVEHVQKLDGLLRDVQQSLASSAEDAPKRIASLREEIATLKKKLASGATPAAKIDPGQVASKLIETAPALGAGKLIVADIVGATDDQLRSTMDSLRAQSKSYAILLATGNVEESKVTIVSAVSDDLVAKGLKAGDWVREVAKLTGGGGGGKPQMAQAGGKDPAKLPEALDAARAFALKFNG